MKIDEYFHSENIYQQNRKNVNRISNKKIRFCFYERNLTILDVLLSTHFHFKKIFPL